MKFLYFIIFMFCLPIFCYDSEFIDFEKEAEDLCQRVNCHLIVGDYARAEKECFDGIKAYQDSEKLHRYYLKALAKRGKERNLIKAYKSLYEKFPHLKFDESILENVTWGIINKGASSEGIAVQVSALYGAYLSQDIWGIDILEKKMDHSNILLRGISTYFSKSLPDKAIHQKLKHLLKEEKNIEVKKSVIDAIGYQQIKDLENDLRLILTGIEAPLEEKICAVQALVNMMDSICFEDFEYLSKSNRSLLRLLACAYMIKKQEVALAGILVPLLEDENRDVRLSTFFALGKMGMKNHLELDFYEMFLSYLSDLDSKVRISAAWALLLIGDKRGEKILEDGLFDSQTETRYYTVGLLSVSGKYGKDLALMAMKKSEDAFVRLNLAQYLISQRIETSLALDEIFEFLSNTKNKIMFQEGFFFNTVQIVIPSNIGHSEFIPNYPEVMHQQVLLSLLNMLAQMNYDKSEEAIKGFLDGKLWGISAMAAGVLLIEGNQEVVEIMKKYLENEDDSLSLQAALTLTAWGKDEKALRVLENSFEGVDRMKKVCILEVIAKHCTRESLPFLISLLDNPFQSIRVLAASAIVCCLKN